MKRIGSVLLSVLLAVGILFQPVSAKAASKNSLRTLLDSQTLYPTITGETYCDTITAQILAAITNDSMDTYDKVKACYDYLINESCYRGCGTPEPYTGIGDPDPFYLVGEDGYLPSGAMGAARMLKYRSGVCDSYALAFASLCRQIGLNCCVVSGQTQKSGGGYTPHTWCEMWLNGKAYYFDPDVEDNIANGGKSKSAGHGKITCQYFGKTYTQTPARFQRVEMIYPDFLPLTSLSKGGAEHYPDQFLTEVQEISQNVSSFEEYVGNMMAVETQYQQGLRTWTPQFNGICYYCY